MTDTSRADEVAAYETAVRRHLADLPPAVREDLLADLETHLSEVAAELGPGTTLAQRLGSPEAYARELREAAELEGTAREDAGGRERLVAAMARVAGLADRYTTSAGAGTFAEFWRSLRPAWWVVRGVAAAGVVLYVLLAFGLVSASSYYSMIPPLLLLLVLCIVGIWCSVRLATRSAQWRAPGRWAVTVGGLVLVWFAALSFLDVYWGTAYVPTGDGSAYSPYGHVEDVYPYTEDGELLTDVYLLDQYGSPLYLGDPSRCSVVSENLFERPGDGDAYGAEGEYGYQYPLCVPGDEDPTPSADPSERGTDLPEDSSDAPDETALPEEGPTSDAASASDAAPTADATPTADEPTTP